MPVSSYINPVFSLSEADKTELKNLARQVITNALELHKFTLPAEPKSKALQQVSASFVTLYSKNKLHNNKELRGCIGCYTSEQPLWQGACQHAYSSAFEDSRFTPLQKIELSTLHIEISILSKLVALENNGEQALLATLVPDVDGLLLKERTLFEANRSAIFLPSVWRSLRTAESFVTALKQKGGWPQDYWSENIELFRFHTLIF